MRSPSRTSIDGPWIGDLGVFIAVFDASLMMESARFYRISVFISVVLGLRNRAFRGRVPSIRTPSTSLES